MRRACLVVLALVAGLLCGVGRPAVSRADVPPSDRDRFVTLWDARFHAKDAFQAYLDSDAEYDDGYNGYPFDDKVALADALVAHWEANEPGFADGIDHATPPGGLWPSRPGEPDEEFPDYVADGALPTRELVVYVVYELIFEKNAFKDRLLQESVGAADGLPDPKGVLDPSHAEPPPAGRPGTPLDEVLTLIQSTLVEAEDVYDAHRPVDAGNDIPEPEVTTPASTVAARPWPGTSGKTTAAAEPAGRTPVSTGFRQLGMLTDFTACAQREATTYVECKPGQVAPVACLAPLAPYVDLLGGVHVCLRTGPSVNPAGIATEMQVLRDPTFPAGVHVWVYYQAFTGTPALRLGFGGSDDGSAPYVGIQEKQSITAVLNPVSLAGLALDARSTVTHDGPASATAVAVEYGYGPGPSGPDTALARLTIENAPATTQVDACHSFLGSAALVPCATSSPLGTPLPPGTSVTEVAVGHSVTLPTALPRLRVHVVSNGPDSRTTAKATLPELAASVKVRLESRPAFVAPETTLIAYDASDEMDGVTADVRVVKPGPEPAYRHAAVSVARLPRKVTVVLQPQSVTYQANQPVAASMAGEDALTAVYDQGIPGTPDAVYKSAELHVSNVPQQVAMTLPQDANPQQPGVQPPRLYTLTMSNSTGPHVVDSLTGRFRDYALQADVHAAARGIPLGTYSLQLPSTGHHEVVWHGAAIDEIAVWGAVAQWRFSATVAHTPAYWRLGLDDKSVVADATNAGGSEITAWITNTATVLTPPAGYTNAVVGEVTLLPSFAANPNAKLVSAAIHVVGLKHVAATPGDPKLGTPSTFDVQAGGGGTFYVWVKVHNQTVNPVRHGLVSAVVTDFPGAVGGSFGADAFDVTTSNNPTLQAYAEWGSTIALALLPPVLSLHGLAIRDGGPPYDVAVAGRVFLTGLPNHVHVEKGKILVTGFRPTIDRLQVDIVRIADPAKVIVAYADLQNVPTGAASSFDVAYTVTKATSKAQTITANVTASAPMGPLFVRAGGATYAAFAEVSNLPASMTLWAHDAEGALDMTWDASQRIASIWAAFEVRTGVLSPFGVRGALHLEQVPKKWTISFGRDPNGHGPRYDYWTPEPVDPAQRLDVTAVANEALVSAASAVAASLYFKVVDLGASSSLVKTANNDLVLLSDRLTRFTAIVCALMKSQSSKPSPPPSSGWIKLGYQQDVSIESVASFLTLDVQNVSSLVVEPGISSRLSGDFGSFAIGWAALAVKVDAHIAVGVQLKILDWWTIPLATATMTTLFLPVTLHAYRTGEYEVTSVPIGWTGRVLHVTVRPKPYAIATSGVGMTLPGVVGGQTTYHLTPNVLWPGGTLLTNIVTAIYWGNGTFKLRVT